MTKSLITYPWDTPPAEGQAIEVAQGVLWMRLPLPMALDHVNVFAFDEGDSWTVVDTGFSSKRSKAIWETLLAYKRAGMSDTEYAQRSTERPFNFADCVDPMPLGYTRLVDGETITFGGRTWDIRMGHGHAPEHATFWSRDDNLIVGGDQLLPSISANLGVYPTEPEADPVQDWLVACESFQPHARPDHLVLPGHKLPFTGLPLRLRQMIDNHHGALERLIAHLKTPRTGGACFEPLFKRKIGRGEYGLALVEALAHLNHLHQTGVATRTMGDDGAWRWQT